jgi:hypothetical protein
MPASGASTAKARLRIVARRTLQFAWALLVKAERKIWLQATSFIENSLLPQPCKVQLESVMRHGGDEETSFRSADKGRGIQGLLGGNPWLASTP